MFSFLPFAQFLSTLLFGMVFKLSPFALLMLAHKGEECGLRFFAWGFCFLYKFQDETWGNSTYAKAAICIVLPKHTFIITYHNSHTFQLLRV
jgi:hypothetical protein